MKLFSAGISLMLFSTLLTNRPARAEQWIAPTPEELRMTAQPEVPGASAIYLYREEKTDDSLHSFDIYVRIKVLTERGRDQANIELPYVSDSSNGSVEITDISGRTIHSDGTVIPFVGKPYQKLMEKSGTAKQMAKVFTLPDVQVGSILEYRYTRRLDDNWFAAPRWYVQTGMYTRKVHFSWRPTNKQLISNDDRGQLTSVIAWTPILPKGSEVKLVRLPAASLQTEGQSIITLDMQNILPVPKEEYMPPMRSLTYRVLFFYSPYRSMEEFWKSEGKHWAKQQDKFIGPGSAVGAIVQQETTASDTQEQKLRKLYASVMKLENTDFTR